MPGRPFEFNGNPVSTAARSANGLEITISDFLSR